jgi:hypothetical protein
LGSWKEEKYFANNIMKAFQARIKNNKLIINLNPHEFH